MPGRRRGKVQPKSTPVKKIHEAKPSVKELPETLTIKIHTSDVPEVVKTGLVGFSSIQCYWSGLEKLMPELSGSSGYLKKTWTGVLPESIQNFKIDEINSFDGNINISGTDLPVFVKRLHLLNPRNAMEGEYIWPHEGALPAPSELWKSALGKINFVLNEAYVDALFALCADRLVTSGISPHWVRCYGTCTGRVEKYLYDITDEYEDLKDEPWWKRNQRNGIFKHIRPQISSETNTFFTTGLSDITTDDFCEIVDTVPTQTINDSIENIEPETVEGNFILKTPTLRMRKVSENNSYSDNLSEEMSDDDELQQFVEFQDFPVQITLLEKADGTMDELLDAEDENDPTLSSTKEERWIAWLFQVIAALTCAQHYFGFVHNDLHTNNIMWTGTGETHLYYSIHKGKNSFIYKVPTYGRIMKIIDFGRATYHLPEPGGFFISDAFQEGNDAAHQYNIEPFYNPNEEPLGPNPSFDLGRLAVSLIESLYPTRPEPCKPIKIMSKEGTKMYTETVSPVYNLLWEWILDDEGKNIVRTPNGEERYPDFDLYRALSRDIHNAVPKKCVEHSVFQRFRYSDKERISGNIYQLNI